MTSPPLEIDECFLGGRTGGASAPPPIFEFEKPSKNPRPSQTMLLKGTEENNVLLNEGSLICLPGKLTLQMWHPYNLNAYILPVFLAGLLLNYNGL